MSSNDRALKNKSMLKDRLEIASILCYRSHTFYNRIKNILILPNLLLSSISAIINNQNFNAQTMKIFNTIINFFTILLLGLQSSLKVSENADAFKQKGNEMIKLLHDIESKEALEQDSIEFITSSTAQYDMIISSLPSIPHHIKKSVRSEFATLKHLPLIINGVDKVEVNNHDV